MPREETSWKERLGQRINITFRRVDRSRPLPPLRAPRADGGFTRPPEWGPVQVSILTAKVPLPPEDPPAEDDDPGAEEEKMDTSA